VLELQDEKMLTFSTYFYFMQYFFPKKKMYRQFHAISVRNGELNFCVKSRAHMDEMLTWTFESPYPVACVALGGSLD